MDCVGTMSPLGMRVGEGLVQDMCSEANVVLLQHFIVAIIGSWSLRGNFLRGGGGSVAISNTPQVASCVNQNKFVRATT